MAAIRALPDTDAKLLAWVNNFKTIITATPTTYGLSAAQATSFGTLVTNFSTALAACDPGVRNKSSTATKNSCRDLLKKSARELSSIITGQPNVTDSQRYALGLNVRAIPQPVPPPSNQPLIEVVSVIGRKVSLRFKSTATIGKRGRPAGTIGLQVYSMVGTQFTENPADWTFCGTTSKVYFDVEFPASVEAGSQVFFVASWVNPRLQTGPASNPVSTFLQFSNTVVTVPQVGRKLRAA